MNIQLTTPHQDIVLKTLRDGGKLICWYESSKDILLQGWVYALDDKDGNSLPIRSDTVRKLFKLKFIERKCDYPALGVDSYFLTDLGREWLEINKI